MAHSKLLPSCLSTCSSRLHSSQCQDQPTQQTGRPTPPEAVRASVQSAVFCTISCRKDREGTKIGSFPSPSYNRQPLVRSGAAICHRRQIPKGEQDGTDKENSTVGGYKRSSFKGSFTFCQAATAHSESRSVMDPSLPTSLRHPPLTSLCNWAGSPPR